MPRVTQRLTVGRVVEDQMLIIESVFPLVLYQFRHLIDWKDTSSAARKTVISSKHYFTPFSIYLACCFSSPDVNSPVSRSLFRDYLNGDENDANDAQETQQSCDLHASLSSTCNSLKT